MAVRFGADEAGKGPAIGSMFAAAVAGPAAAVPDDVDDSKRLSDTRRAELARAIRGADDLRTGVAEVSVERIDSETDMNTLTVAAQAEALSAVLEGGERGVVDAGDTDEGRFADRVTDRLPVAVDLTAEHGADGRYPHVAAASVLAKEAREDHVAALAERFGDVGSGYPSDPTTRSFLADYVDREGELPPCARVSWSTCEDVLAAAEQSSLAEF